MYFDIGANIGAWSLKNSQNADKIIAVEASPRTFEKLFDNTKNNAKITCINYAVCDSKEDFVDFFESNYDTISSINLDWLTSEKSRFCNVTGFSRIRCKTISIDKLIEIYGKPILIKIDVEGGEDKVVSSLTQKVDNLCFEWASETNDVTFRCLDHLSTLGYTEFAIQMQDDYLYRPQSSCYQNLHSIKEKLKNTIPKQAWGMIWAK